MRSNGAALGDADAVGERLRPLGEERRHLLGRLQVVLGVLAAQLVRGVERRAVADGDQHVLEAMALPHVVVDVVGGDAAHAEPLRQLHQRPVALAVAVDEVVLQLDPEVLPAERRRRSDGPPPPPLDSCPAATSDGTSPFLQPERAMSPSAVAGQRLEVQRRLAALVRQVGVGEEEAEVGVAALRLAEEGEVVSRPASVTSAPVMGRTPNAFAVWANAIAP